MKRQQVGFTLVELLVVITIIGILMGLLIPAVNAAREAARRNQCSTQIKNLSLAAIQHEGSKGELPGWIQKFGHYAGTGDPSDPGNGAGQHPKVGTWAVALLPWLDAQPTYEHWTEDRYPIVSDGNGEYTASDDGYHRLAAPNLAILQCPSNPVAVGDLGKNSYIANNGAQPFGGGSNPGISFEKSQDRANGAFNNKYGGSGGVLSGPKVRLDDFKDGQGNTMLFAENVQALPWHRAGFTNGTQLLAAAAGEIVYPPQSRYSQGMVWHYEDPQSGSTTLAAAWNRLGTGAPVEPSGVTPTHLINGRVGLAPNDQDIFTAVMTAGNAANLARPSAAHTGGVNAAMADGGTRFIAESIDYRVYQALLTLRGKSSDVPWPEFALDDDAY